MSSVSIAEVAVLIVGFRNAADVSACLAALSCATSPSFDVFICENGGIKAYYELLEELLAPSGPCQSSDGQTDILKIKFGSFTHVRPLRLRTRPSNVWIGCAKGNLGYAGGVNAWLEPLQSISGWKGAWVLNPDTEPEDFALAALIERAESGMKGMVGSTILDVGEREAVRYRGGLNWQRFGARAIAIGRGERLNARYDLSAIEAAMDSPSGASMYVTRFCISKIGLMDERYFLFFEDLDWGLRAKSLGLGYAGVSIVRHKRGTTTGSANSQTRIPQFSVYLEHRNGLNFVRKHFPWTIPVRIVVSILYAIRFLMKGSPENFMATLQGVLAALRGEVGRPSKYHELD